MAEVGAEHHRLYRELGVGADASAAEIDKAYRKRARQTHPDAGGNAEAFHALTHAYAVLSDPDRRQAYDETGYEGELVAEVVATRAMERIHELVGSVLDSDLPFEEVDLVSAIRETLVKQKAEIGAAVRRLEQQAKRADLMAGRFLKKSGDNFIRGLLERRAADTRQKAEKTRHEEAIFAKAIELLADYSFEYREAEALQPAGAGARTAPGMRLTPRNARG